MKSWFKVWLYALGSFSDKKTKPYDHQVTIVLPFFNATRVNPPAVT